MAVRFYATGAPWWWPYQTASLGHGRDPNRLSERDHYRMLLDNGMWTWAKARREPPDLDVWLGRLRLKADQLARRPDVAEVWVVLPDWPRAPRVTLEALGRPIARPLCRDYTCLVPVHFGRFSLVHGLPELGEAADAAARVDGAVLALPMKLYCTRPTARSSRVPLPDCQLALAAAARRVWEGPIHAFAPTLSPPHIARLAKLGITSFDSNTWARPNPRFTRGVGPWGPKNMTEKDAFFRLAIERLEAAGVRLEAAPARPAGQPL